MTIFERVYKLNLPLGSYVVTGGSVLEAYGIRAASDLDLLATEELYQELKSRGWVEEHTSITTPNGRKLVDGDREVVLDLHVGEYRPSTVELIARADIVEGFPFLTLHDLRDFKRAMARDKDLEDIALIDTYLKKAAAR